MMISTKGRYALRVLVDLAEHPSQGYIPLKEIAERQEISEKYLEIVLKSLVRANVLTGLRGKGGGYRLTRPPEAYTVGEILRLSEDSLAPVSCLSQDALPCARAGECRTRALWDGLDQLIGKYLDSFTIADLMRPTPPEA
ncbi:Rrf2 family transcriptional regulator [Oscillibacter sp.]|uniref:RrF2 family transcriptional regulator n=1 Tax=Oscillibacter sp. TaxID=1945593 RepID=UPI0026277CB8|nr:Rrf2 family transcriptional regulator [Oscillibacter sp.]MDD3347817.1 Rrf2 family transcriptional regulator [Oscillibacter sp.]